MQILVVVSFSFRLLEFGVSTCYAA